MSISGSSDEFAYQTRLVVYNFLGLVPAAPSQSDDEAESSQSEQQQLQDTRSPSPWNDALGTLPTVSLIDRLSESEAQQMRMKMVCDEVADKVRRVESMSSELPSQGASEEPSKDVKQRNKHHERLDLELVRNAVLNELKQKVPDRGRSPNDGSSDDTASGPITIIQKKNRLKILGDSITSVEEADIRRRLSLQPVSAAARSSEMPFGRASVQMMPHSALAGAGSSFGGRTSTARRPTTLLSSSTPSADTTLASSRDKLSQIDEERELDETNGSDLEIDGQADDASSRDAPMSASVASVVHFTPRPSRVLTPVSFDRQSSSRSGSSRRCSTYIDITEVDVESLVKSKALPAITTLKRELSIAFEELGKSHQTGDDMGGLGPNVASGDVARTPESEVADSLRALGDRIQDEYGSRLNSIVQDILGSTSSPSVNYVTLQIVTSQLLQQTQQGWTRVALVMLLGQHLVYELLRQGCTGISHMAEYTAKLVEDHAADFIINNGGWNSISDIGVMETEASLSTSDIDYKLIPEFNCSSGDSLESYFGSTNAALLEATPLRNSVAAESFQETFLPDAKEQVDSIPWASDVSESFVEPSTEVSLSSAEKTSPQGLTVSTPPDADLPPPDQSIEGDIVLLRQNSQQYMDEMESARRTVALTQSGAFVGITLLTILASWLLYQRFGRVA